MAVVSCPRGDDKLKSDLTELKTGGIDTLVSLLERDEAAWLGLGDEGPLASAFSSGGPPEAHKRLDRLASIFGRQNLFVELQRHQEREEECRNQALLSLASSLNLPVIATNGVAAR